MKLTAMIHATALIAALVPATASAGALQRYLLVVGANSGGGDRIRLQYAVSDAERFARVMTELGGVPPENEMVLRDPKVGDLLQAIDRLQTRIAADRRRASTPGGRTEVFLYYSGHADDKGLLLGEDRLSYRTLRDRLDEMPVDVRIAILDACASGAFTRLKGGRSRPPFLVDDASTMRGHAFLTSSSETESAQESDRVGASYFTHYLVSGFRGAADASGDGRVTLSEAYQFAFAETLGRTVDTKGGAQHPSYDINLSGAGDVVITDVRQTTARLVLGDDLEGRMFVRTSARMFIAELYKERGRRIEIGVEPGAYEVRMERDRMAFVATTTVSDDSSVTLDARRFGVAALEPTRRRGGESTPTFAVAGRNRITLLTGMWGSHGDAVRVWGRDFDVVSGLQYTRYLRDDLAVTAGFAAFGAAAQVDLIGGVAIPVDLQWNPIGRSHPNMFVKPLLSAGLMPISSADFQSRRRSTIGVRVGAGLDVHLNHTLVVPLNLRLNAVPALEPASLHDNFGGLELSTGFGFMFGGRR